LLQAIGGGLYCVDLESRSKIRFEGDGGEQSQGWLEPGRFIEIGRCQIRRTDSNPPLSPEARMLDPFASTGEGLFTHELCRAGLELPVRAREGSAPWRIDGTLALLGRSESCQLVLADETVSKHHACLVRTSAGMWVVELATREGVQVNGVHVRWAWLDDGDTVRIGRFTFILRYEWVSGAIRRTDVPLHAGAVGGAAHAESTAGRSVEAHRDTKALALRSEHRARGLIKAERYTPQELAQSGGSFGGTELEAMPPGGPAGLAMWRQQMQLMESFHNDMLLMIQMFMAMHREHLASVREELDRVRQLTSELSTLQAKLGGSAVGAEMALTYGTGDARGEPTPPGHEERNTGEERDERAATRTGASDAATAHGRSGESAAESARAESGGTSKRPKRAAARETVGAGMSTAEMHALLTKRIAELQKERQGYWQKILSTINR
jgi:hypothetical protein